jgi:DNA-binding FadR family transcriptional regulator
VDFNISQHQAIYEAISSRDVELATKAVQSHLKDSKENLMAQFND